MSKFVMFSVYDSAVEAYARPFIARSVGEAMRHFTDDRWNPESPLYKHPEHYSLWQIATFQDADAHLEPGVKVIARAHEIPSTDQETA